MTIPNFKPEEFSQNLAKQAQSLVPNDLNDYQKNYVVNKLYQFCILAGNALNQDDSVNFTESQANIIVQLIGEWTFHKNVDLIRAGIAEDCWDPVLQQVAFAVFEAAKHVETNKLEQSKALKLIEDVVKDSYSKSLMELSRSGKIKEDQIPEIMAYSNIDVMAKDDPPELTKEQEEKILKCASLALVLKSLPQEKVSRILSGMDPETAKQIMHFINVPDLDKKLDNNLANNFLSGFKQSLFIPKSHTQKSVLHKKISSLRDLYDDYFIAKQVKFERPYVQQFIQDCLTIDNKGNTKISPYIEDLIYEYLKSKLTA